VQVQSSKVLISDAPSESEARCRSTQGKFSTSSPATAPEMLAFGSHSWIASRSRARSPSVLMSRFVLKGDQMEEDSKQCRINSETGPGMHERVRS
jgi:hypothetical protein